ncbi:MAG: RHS repeat protein, partial [Candidatus Omnitrophica bacterium]|nr:RHS repeat protein [Candidatus Omnitrophota bacterium]
MMIKRKLFYKFISVFILAVFIFNSSILCTPACAEFSCWNDGSIASAEGGSTFPPAAQKGNPNPTGTEKIADPVNVATGNFAYEHTDILIPGRGMPFEFKRFYNNQDDYDGPFGIGWNHNYNIFLIEAGDSEKSYVIRRNPDGNKDIFTKNQDGAYTSPAGVFDTLVKTPQGYLITTRHGLKYQFNQSNYLSSITDRNNNTVTLTYDADIGLLSKITDTVGRITTFTYTPERKISQVTDFTGRSFKYAYLNNDLTTVTLPAIQGYPDGLATKYTYQNHNLDSIVDPKGYVYLKITYDTHDRVEKMTQGLSGYEFIYSKKLTKYYDLNGNRIDYYLNDDGTINKKIEYTSGPDYETKYEYNSDKLVTKIIYPRNNSLISTYDNKANLLSLQQNPIAGSNAASLITAFTYEPRFNYIKTATDPKGSSTTYYYDYEEASLGDLNSDGITNQANGNLMKISLPVVNNQIPELKYTYNSFGQPLIITDPNNISTKFEYYPATGYLAKTTKALNALNILNEFYYDALGNIASFKDPNGNITSFEYDSHNNLVKSIQPAPFNYVATYIYDANDNLTQTNKQTNDANNPWHSVYYAYDNLDRLVSVKDELDNLATYSYDANSNLIKTTDPAANSTIYTYNERNQAKKVTDANGYITEYSFDANANLSQIKDANGNVTVYTYDDFDRLIKMTYADNSCEEYAYDQNSNLLSKKDPNARVIYYEYDVLNRMIEKGLFPKGAFPDSVVNFNYDLASRLTAATDVNGAISYTYDALNRIAQVVYPGNKAVGYQYDVNSNRIKLIYPDTSFITYNYDELNRLTAIKEQAGQNIASYSYDALSRRTEAVLGNSAKVNYTYDAVGRLTNLNNSINQAAISSFNYTYDKSSNRKSMTTQLGVHNYTYDKTYQLKTVDYPDNYVFSDVSFSYDKTGNRVSLIEQTSPQTTSTYTTNLLNQYAKINSQDYTYDSNGNLASNGASTYSYDYEDRLTSVTKSGMTASYKYDSFGRRIEKTVGDAAVKYLYDGDQIIAEYNGAGTLIKKFIYGVGIDEVLKGLSPQGTVPEWYYHYDGLGSVTALTNSAG